MRTRPRFSSVLLIAASFVLPAGGCGSRDASGLSTDPTITLTLSPTSATVEQGASVVVTGTATLGGAFTGTATVTVEGAPTGVTGTVGLSQTSGAVPVTIAVASSVPPRTYALTVRAAEAGVSSTAPFSLTVIQPPSSANEIFHETWSGTIDTSVWSDGYRPSNHSVVSDPTGSGRGQVFRATHTSNGGAGFLAHWIYGTGQVNPTGEVFVRTWIYVPAGFDASNYAKMLIVKGNRTDNLFSSFGQAGIAANGTNFFESYVSLGAPSHPDPGVHFYTYHVDMPGNFGDIRNTQAAALQDRQPTPGAWHKFEFWVKQNTVGQSDGGQRVWMDDVLILEWTGLRFRTDEVLQANTIVLTFSSSNNTGQVWYVDDVHVFDQLPSGMPGW